MILANNSVAIDELAFYRLSKIQHENVSLITIHIGFTSGNPSSVGFNKVKFVIISKEWVRFFLA
jgi:hypothetical protein